VRWRKWIFWTSLVTVAGICVALLAQYRPESLRERIRRSLAERLNAEVDIGGLTVGFMPLRLAGSDITFRVRSRPDLPPFISIEHVWMDLGLFSVARKHVETVHVDGLVIQVPPKDARNTIGGESVPGDEGQFNPSKVIVERLLTHNAVLSFTSTKPNHRPHVFEIQDLELRDLGFDRVVPFRAQLINPVPRGLIQADGSFGPWMKDDPAETPVSGTYVFSDADLSTIDGIRGRLSSKGAFGGRITEIDVRGVTTTPDFNLTLGGQPLPLETSFHATVDGTNGTTRLQQVDAMLGQSSIVAKGAVVNLPGPSGHNIDLDVRVGKGRIEDLLSLVIPAKSQAIASGTITSHATVHLPPGHSSILERLRVSGDFSLDRTQFERKVQERIREFSRRTQGKNRDEMQRTVASDMKGQFALADGVMRLRDLGFEVPGAVVTLAGTCNLRTRALDMEGTLKMDTSVSRAVGGFKSIFLKIVDPFFRKNGKTVLPIRIGGTIDDPQPGLRLRKK
jgi:hypothetical protein